MNLLKSSHYYFVEYNLRYTKHLNFAATRSQKKSRLFDNTDQEKHKSEQIYIRNPMTT